MEIKVTLDPRPSANVRVILPRPASTGGRSPLWFLDSYGSETGLSKRVSDILLFDRSGTLVRRQDLRPLERIDVADYGEIRYSVELTPRQGQFSEAHISVLRDDTGQLMLDDILPQGIAKAVKLKVDAPAGWRVIHTEIETQPGAIEIEDHQRSVIYLGSGIRVHDLRSGGARIKLAISGEWQFTDADAAEMVRSVFAQYEKIFGKVAAPILTVRLQKLVSVSGFGAWEADTRGRNVTISSTDMPFKSQSLQRLHEQLRHEIFHLWVPNGLNLTGSYDWFYEGFALYLSLKAGVAANRIRFDDYLDTLSRAYSIDLIRPSRLSLIEASRERWKASNTDIYARGMLVAFLCDLSLLERSKGKISVGDVLRRAYERHGVSKSSMDGNEAIVSLLREFAELRPIVDRYIAGSEPIDLEAAVKTAGLVYDKSMLRVVAKPSGGQRDLLEKLGYNSWRKLSEGKR